MNAYFLSTVCDIADSSIWGGKRARCFIASVSMQYFLHFFQALLRGALCQQSAVILICMAIDRYMCMLHPVSYHKRSSKKVRKCILKKRISKEKEKGEKVKINLTFNSWHKMRCASPNLFLILFTSEYKLSSS